MASTTQTSREDQPQQWRPSARQAVPGTAAHAPVYPSFGSSGIALGSGLAEAVRHDPEHAAAQVAHGLLAEGAGEVLSRFASSLCRFLEPDSSLAVGSGVLQERLQALEKQIEELSRRLQAAPAAALPATGEIATSHASLLAALREQVAARPEDSARLVRTILGELGTAAATVPGGGDQATAAEVEAPGMRLRQVAILGVALGDQLLGEMMKHLSDSEIEEITQTITTQTSVGADEMDRVLARFQQRLAAGEWLVQGGTGLARTALERAVGPHKAQEILDRVTSRVASGFYMLKNVAPDQIAPFISQEHPQTIALILSQLAPAQAAGILARLPEAMQADVAYRTATMENITPNVIKQIEESLESSLRDILGGNQDVGGPKVVADILNLTGSSVEKNVLDQMDAQDPEVSETVRNLMFVFDDIKQLPDHEIQSLLAEVNQMDLAMSLKAASEELKNKFMSNIPEQVRTSITEEMEFLGPMRLSEVEAAQLRIVQQVRQLEEQGRITIVRGDADNIYV